ncbi:hypothetical protein [Pseudoalteromonas byunsanensis]|uniref:Uncharacterized protein n=1 Tax=Pseudoalteromonas byunsanensis TaxID=327939 RepID=A0A1S1NBG8_9GAMM|nr:hypothetical protein [Pseudoalteromonas byunsanensis]OHU96726.1 hypothetical protein BIW53_05220 [Pseudoalteromonas byunsanensis]
MQKTSLIYCLPFVCVTSQAANLYHQSSECTVNPDLETIRVSSLYTDIRGKSQKTIEEEAKLLTLEKIQAKMNEHNSDYVIKYVSFKYDDKEFVNSYVSLQPVKSCNNAVEINRKYVHRLHSKIINFQGKLDLDTTTTLKLRGQPKAIMPLSIKDVTVTHTAPFGIELGASYASAENKVGHFSALWPVNNTTKIAFLGRQNAFIFQNDKLTGYQFNRSLLPIDLRNRIELIPQQPIFSFIHNKEDVSVDKFINAEQLDSLKKYYNNVQTVNLKVSDTSVRAQLEGLSIGTELSTQLKVNMMPCFDGKTGIDQFIDEHESSLLRVIGFANKVSYITGCSQSIQLHHSGKVHSMELFEPLSQTNGFLHALSNLLAPMQNWSYSGISYGDSQQALRDFKTKIKDNGVIEVDSQNWVGVFNVYENTLANATLYPKSIL